MARVLVLGSNRGIGLEICRQLRARGDEVVAACRRSSDALDALDGVTVVTGVDVTDRPSLDALAEKVGADSIDTLWVVAGILRGTSLDNLDVDVLREQFEVNAIGPLQATVAMLPTLKNPSKLALVTSRMGSIADNDSGGSYGYRMSKSALNSAGKSLAVDLGSRGIAVALLHPGWVRTDMTAGNGLIDANESAAGLITQMDALTQGTSGIFVHQSGEKLPW